MQEIGSAKAEAKRMQLDLDAESSKRRDLQIEVKALKRQVEQQTRPFVAALIDGDADYYVVYFIHCYSGIVLFRLTFD